MRYGFIVPKGDPRTVAVLARGGGGGLGRRLLLRRHLCRRDGDLRSVGHDGGDGDGDEARSAGRDLDAPARRRPWKLARETMTLDHLSGGRLVLPVGLGALDDGGFSKVGEPTDRKVRAELLDESLAILTGLWSGEPFSYEGEHYHIKEMTFLPPPIQRPRIPIWVVGAWPSKRSMSRALRYDGLLAYTTRGEVTPEDIRVMRAYVEENKEADGTFDIVWEGVTPGDDPERAVSMVRPLAEAGATWWIESPWSPPNEPEDLRRRIEQGPPRIEP